MAGDAARLPVVVAVEAAEPTVVVHRLVEVDLVARRAEGGAVPGVERLEKGLSMGLGVEVEREVVQGAQVIEGSFEFSTSSASEPTQPL